LSLTKAIITILPQWRWFWTSNWNRGQQQSTGTPAKLSSVVLNLFYISYPFIEQGYQIYPNTLNGDHLLKIRIQKLTF